MTDKKLKVVVFDKDGGWVLINPAPEDYKNEVYVVDPDLSQVEGLPPEAWAFVDGEVVPNTESEYVSMGTPKPINKMTRPLLLGLGFSLVLIIVLIKLLTS